jgi:hippurate hydrolase
MQGKDRAALGGSEDFATISHRVPSLLLGIAAGRADEGYSYPLHHPRVVFDERALVHGALAYAEAVLGFNK